MILIGAILINQLSILLPSLDMYLLLHRLRLLRLTCLLPLLLSHHLARIPVHPLMVKFFIICQLLFFQILGQIIRVLQCLIERCQVVSEVLATLEGHRVHLVLFRHLFITK